MIALFLHLSIFGCSENKPAPDVAANIDADADADSDADADGEPGEGGDVAEAGGTTTISCGEASVTCTGGSAGDTSGTFGLDGGCTTTGTPLNEYKASNTSPGGGGIGAQLSGAGAGQ